MPPRKKKKNEKLTWYSRLLDVSAVEAVAIVAVSIGVLRFCEVPVPLVDNAIARVKYMVNPPPRLQEPGEDVAATMKDAAEGRPLVLIDVLYQLRHFCSEKAQASCGEWLGALPGVAAAVSRGPGTWDRKPLKKAVALELDQLLGGVASRPEAGLRMNDILAIGQELVDSAPKSVKRDLMAANLADKFAATDEVVME
mmetsp:Transcript_71600/g.165574  ORF Transcript_71600/g.165574 Transcript_71600/m.165574 type:complete len:197 (-) Transcript_71600:88-678(-)|eukprot:CAMPEP_0171127102 /NCGR_PEP_ID=MMETSP0766_2-20121228/114612_1 /TAXON_ID=439317 /ORGANISM="Gambierdiscus australes, Strain CAWD 149" /LENGTH=196 /DNA_ID=CAMNT_0011590185 /DNA_START=125 /DNA_END=715 /DNA_ORIENTATION=+